MEFSHVSVLLKETVDGAFTDPKGVYADLTTGGGGHSLELAKRLDGGRLICFDQDKEALEAAGERLKGLPVTFVRSNFCEMKSVLADLGIKELDGIIADLGVSSHQLDTAERGFSFHNDAPLDMRMSGEGLSARDVVNEYDEGELAKILFDYGEEKFGNRIARGIVNARLTAPIETTGQLAEIIKSSVPAAYRREKNPCRKSFQAIRIEVNHELDVLETALTDGFDVLFCVSVIRQSSRGLLRIFSIILSFALLLRGFLSSSSGEAVIGFLSTSLPIGFLPHTHTGNSGGHVQPVQNSLKRFLTILSSRE